MRRPLGWLCLLLAISITWLGQALAGDEALVEEVLQDVEAGDLAHARALVDLADAEDSTTHHRCELLTWIVDLAELQRGLRPRDEVLAKGRALRVEPSDLPLLRRSQRALGSGRSYLDPQVRAAYHAIAPTLSPEMLFVLTRDPERRVRRLAVSALAEQLAPLRAGVSAGGCLTPAEQLRLADPAQLQILIDRLSDRTGDRTDRIPADLAVRSPGTATALHALVLIEAAALPALQEQQDREGVAATIAAIHSAVANRLRRFPESTWFCAEGDHARAHGVALEHCGRQLPGAARFCPKCGDEVRTVCATCGELVRSGSQFCPSCGGAASDPSGSCVRCGAAAPPKSGFCPQCGLDLQQGE
jgi:RNA polymerase subunit RPABC4/transcription elongation factor Spt4